MNRSLVVIGNFDGVHRGHQAVLSSVHREAAKRGLTARLLTFHPHPAVTLGRRAPAVLTTLERKLELVARACPGIEPIVTEFTPEFARQTPEAFVDRVLGQQLHAAMVMVGANFRFGRDRAGDLAALARLGATAGFEVEPTQLLGDAQGAWSSTRIRALLATGDVAGARALLGRPHMLSGVVSRGDQRGRRLGFPTCNIAAFEEALPPLGVYAVLIDRVDRDAAGAPPRARAMARGVANIGLRPTIGGGERPLLEAHAFDFDEDVYGTELRVHLVAHLRAERKFESLDALRSQIADDCSVAREATADSTPNPALGGAWA